MRVYRRRSGTKRQLVGVLEGAMLVGSQAFSSVEQLWEIFVGRGATQSHGARVKPADESSS